MIARIMAIASLAAMSAAPAAPIRTASLDALVRAYPDQLASHDETDLVWRDGTRQKVFDGKPDKSFDEKLRNASIRDQLSQIYRKGRLTKPPGPQDMIPAASEIPNFLTKCRKLREGRNSPASEAG